MFRFESWESDGTTLSEASIQSWTSITSGDTSVFGDEIKDGRKPKELKFTAKQLAQNSASQHFPTFNVDKNTAKCAMMHWACHVGWCLCKYQYQPLTPLHLLPNTPITHHSDIRYAKFDVNQLTNVPPASITTQRRSSSYCPTAQNDALAVNVTGKRHSSFSANSLPTSRKSSASNMEVLAKESSV